MELGLSWDDELFESKQKKLERPKQQPYNVKVCEKQYYFNASPPSDDIQKQNVTKFQADYWYQIGQHHKSVEAYMCIHKNPQVKSTTVERDVDESIIRCHLKLGNISMALGFLSNLIKKQGEDTSLLLLLAKICSATGNIQGEITCLKRCISLHSYNHNFWYSLAKAYNKAHELIDKESATNTELTDIIDAILQLNTAKNYKDCLKLSINCHHCKCTTKMTLLDKAFMKNDDNKCIPNERVVEFSKQPTGKSINEEHFYCQEQPSEAECLISKDLKEKLSIQENCTLSITHTSESYGEKNSHVDEVPYVIVGQEQSDGCNFTMTIIRDLDDESLYIFSKESRQQELSLLVFFCLLRTRFLLQRAIWTSASFVKEKLSQTMVDVKEDINKCVLCHCDELKKCILKQMELEDASVGGQQIEKMDMHSLYQGGNQKHWN